MLISYQITYADLADQLPQYATLKAIGYPTPYLLRVVLEQAGLNALAGWVPAWLLGLVLYRVISEIALLPLRMSVEITVGEPRPHPWHVPDFGRDRGSPGDRGRPRRGVLMCSAIVAEPAADSGSRGSDRTAGRRDASMALNHFYGAGVARNQVLFDNNIAIPPGQLVVMTGPSGAGKTTLLTVIGALALGPGGADRGSRARSVAFGAARSRGGAARHRLCLSDAQSVRRAHRLRKRQDGDAARPRAAERDAAARHRHPRAARASATGSITSHGSFRRRAAARGDRSRAGQPPAPNPRRRADRSARPGFGAQGDRPAQGGDSRRRHRGHHGHP